MRREISFQHFWPAALVTPHAASIFLLFSVNIHIYVHMYIVRRAYLNDGANKRYNLLKMHLTA